MFSLRLVLALFIVAGSGRVSSNDCSETFWRRVLGDGGVQDWDDDYEKWALFTVLFLLFASLTHSKGQVVSSLGLHRGRSRRAWFVGGSHDVWMKCWVWSFSTKRRSRSLGGIINVRLAIFALLNSPGVAAEMLVSR